MIKGMRIDLGYLGSCVELEELEIPWLEDSFEVTHDGYTESGIRVHGVVDEREFTIYPAVWNNAIMIKVD